MKKLDYYFKELGLSKTKEGLLFLSGILLSLGLAVGIFFWKGMGVMMLIPAVVLILFIYVFGMRYPRGIRKRDDEDLEEFVRLFTFFGIYIANGHNVFHALESILPFSSSRMKARLEGLLGSIENDKTVTPFIDFSSRFPDMKVREVMVAIYAMVDEGEGGVYIAQFQHIFGKLSDDRHALAKAKRIEALQNLSFLPLAGSGIAMMMLVVALMEIMGSLMYVI